MTRSSIVGLKETEGGSAPAAALDGYRATGELYIDELHTPMNLHFSRAALR
jgi:hypothetical protein